MAKRTNGIAERAIKALNQGLKIYSNLDCDDRHLESQIPLIKMGLRASASSDTKISPYFISHLFDMPLPVQTDSVVADIFHSRQAQQYAAWLKKSIKTVHDMVRINRIELKQQMKQDYDTKHNVKQPDFKIRDLVLLKDTRITLGSNKTFTKRPYAEKPYVVKQIVFSHGAGSSFKLTEEQTGTDLRGLVAHDRLRHYFRNQAATVQRQILAKARFKPAIRILDDGVINDKHQFLVLFKNRTRKWRKRSQINDGLLNKYQQNRQQNATAQIRRL